jgi:hypothetical protein
LRNFRQALASPHPGQKIHDPARSAFALRGVGD